MWLMGRKGKEANASIRTSRPTTLHSFRDEPNERTDEIIDNDPMYVHVDGQINDQLLIHTELNTAVQEKVMQLSHMNKP